MRARRAEPVPGPADGHGEQREDHAATTAELLAERLDRPMGVLGVLFVFIVLGQVLAKDPLLVVVFSALGWVCWAVFVAEFVLRAHVAGWSARFWRRNWWQVLFLVLPFLRFFRALSFLRLGRLSRFARLGGVVSAGVRGSRSAGRLLSGRISWLVAVTAVVILAASQLHFVTTGIGYGDALYQAAMATITGSGLEGGGLLGRFLRIALAVYSVVVFATLAGSLGAFFLSRPGGTTQAQEEHAPARAGPIGEGGRRPPASSSEQGD